MSGQERSELLEHTRAGLTNPTGRQNYTPQSENYKITKKDTENAFTVNRTLVNSKEYHDKFIGIGESKAVNESLYQQSKRLLENRDASDAERMIVIDARTGKLLVDNLENGAVTSLKTGFTKEQYDSIFEKNNGNGFIMLHNHPGSLRPSGRDILTLWQEKEAIASVVAGHDGTLYVISKMNRSIPLDKIYKKAYNEYVQEGFPRDFAAIKATDRLYETGAFDFIKR